MVRSLVTNNHSYLNATKTWAEANPDKEAGMSEQFDAVNRLLVLDINDVDAIFIMGGTNDFANNSSTFENETPNDFRFTGEAVKEIIRIVSSLEKDVKLYFFTPIVRSVPPYTFNAATQYENGAIVNYEGRYYKFTEPHNGIWTGSDVIEIQERNLIHEQYLWSDNFLNRNGITLKEFCRRLYELIVSYQTPCCDMYNTLGWNFYNFSRYMIPNSADGTHPHRGIYQIARRMVGFINEHRTF